MKCRHLAIELTLTVVLGWRRSWKRGKISLVHNIERKGDGQCRKKEKKILIKPLYQQSFIEGLIFLFISGIGFRTKNCKTRPETPPNLSLRRNRSLPCFYWASEHAAKDSDSSASTQPHFLRTLGACPTKSQAAVAAVITYPNGTVSLMPGGAVSGGIVCLHNNMESPTFWLGAMGFVIIAYGLMKNIKGPIVCGIVFVTAISWFCL
ncbi:hypothetical protein NE237_004939 [Protea cynaroides]|uniref:Uncharacterized protein n=1 Tax=Protea cynaroides TaxID=273540 RepID=A0A9Q0KJX9_9MAGN|nr:hypothetical protein NE237_004939 [Protea cynaroides]